MSQEIYGRAVQELVQRAYNAIPGRDEIKTVQLFDRLLERGHSIHVDDLRRLCKDAGFDELTANHIGHLYDTLCLIRHELDNPNTIDYWPSEIMGRIVARYAI